MTTEWVYEAEYTPSFLTDTDATIELREDGALSSVSAGEDDRVLPFVEAVSGLAITAAKAGAGVTMNLDGPAGFTCTPPKEQTPTQSALNKVMTKQTKLLEREAAVKEQLGSVRDRLRANSSTDYEKLGKHVTALAAELQLLKKEKAANKYSLSRAEAKVCVDNKDLQTRAECKETCTGTLLRIDLETKS